MDYVLIHSRFINSTQIFVKEKKAKKDDLFFHIFNIQLVIELCVEKKDESNPEKIFSFSFRFSENDLEAGFSLLYSFFMKIHNE